MRYVFAGPGNVVALGASPASGAGGNDHQGSSRGILSMLHQIFLSCDEYCCSVTVTLIERRTITNETN